MSFYSFIIKRTISNAVQIVQKDDIKRRKKNYPYLLKPQLADVKKKNFKSTNDIKVQLDIYHRREI